MTTLQRRPLPPRAHMYRRLALNGATAVAIVVGSLIVGAVGYHGLEGMPWLDSFYAAAMILTGMGPSAPLAHASAKVFAICYALFSAVVFLTVMTLILAPIVYRFLHRFHLQTTAEQEPKK